MSVVKVQGNASGTGIFTVAAPATNTDRTLTLPDQTGTILSNAGPFTANASASNGAVTIDASNNVGIGTSSPGAKLQVTSASDDIFRLVATAPYLSFYNGATRTGYIRANSGNFSIVSEDASTAMTFYTAGSERARIDSSGNLLVGTTSFGNVNANALGFSPSSKYLALSHASGTGSGTGYISFGLSTSEIGSITQNGTTAVAYNTTSDYRLKENVRPMTGALARVAALKPCTYTWKSAPDEIGEGFIAHELAEVCPQAVTGEKDAVHENGAIKPQSIDTSFLVATLTAAIQEQQAIIESLTARITALEAK